MILARNAPMKRRFKVMRWEDPAMDKPPRGLRYARTRRAGNGMSSNLQNRHANRLDYADTDYCHDERSYTSCSTGHIPYVRRRGFYARPPPLRCNPNTDAPHYNESDVHFG